MKIRVVKQIQKRPVSLFLLILFLGYFTGITMFTHSHKINGTLIVHSHPYSEAPENHNHSSGQIQVINHLSLFIALFAIIGVLISLFDKKTFRHSVKIISSSQIKIFEYYLLRAPPAC